MDPHDVGALLQSQGRKKTGNAEHVVEMAMRQQEPIEPSKTGTTSKQLPLSAFAAIHQYPVATRFHEEPGMVAISRWNARGSPEKSQTEHLVYASAGRRSGSRNWP
jgi:hypothetical protein